ncbi:MAG: hypothetical protein HQL32_01645 [Planctomycetes bacterium]|nr:hypothetical protein [Planctomycetota bacterium]
MNPFYNFDRWTVLPFTKHKGKTLPQVAFKDPSFIYWADEEGVFNKEPLKSQFKEVYHKLCRIRIPKNRDYVSVRYCLGFNGKFAYFRLCKEEECYYKDRFTYDNIIDCSFPYQIDSSDKGGCRHFMQCIKNLFIGSDSRLTRKTCEKFFDGDYFYE